MSLYGYGTDFVGGFEYPKAKLVVVYDEPEKWARAAILNAAAVQENPWVKHLRESGVYKQIRGLLRQPRATYKPVNPATRKKVLTRELNRVKRIYEWVNPEYADVRKTYDSKVPYEKAKAAALARLIKRANKLGKALGVKVELTQPTVPISQEWLK